ncbi:MAG: Grx4 family monothiol glutaredoxin [Myxococcota bacterium]
MNDSTRERIDQLVKGQPVLLFMKGNRQMPQCGFSAQVVRILDTLLPEYQTVNVLEDGEIREGVKEYSAWPTIPQLYVEGEFLGGCDIITEMYQNGELQEKLKTLAS